MQVYEIRVAGILSPRWSAWFEGMAISSDESDTTMIRGSVIDQAALHGLLNKVRDLGLSLLSVQCVDADTETEGAMGLVECTEGEAQCRY